LSSAREKGLKKLDPSTKGGVLFSLRRASASHFRKPIFLDIKKQWNIAGTGKRKGEERLMIMRK
jgi:hypothetical protein